MGCERQEHKYHELPQRRRDHIHVLRRERRRFLARQEQAAARVLQRNGFADWTVLIGVLLCLELFRWGARRWRQKNFPRKRQLEALLKELDG